jgi:hypothetical protein
MGEIMNDATRVRDSNGVEWCLAIRLYNNAGLIERDKKKTGAPEWVPYHSVGAIVDAKPKGAVSGAEVWLVCDWREHGFMCQEGDPRRERVMQDLVKFVSAAVGDGTLGPDSIWLLGLVQLDGEPRIEVRRKVR